MADFEVTLGVVAGEDKTPFRYVMTKDLIGTDSAIITAGNYLGIDVHYTLCYAQIVLITSADVGNRKVAVDADGWSIYKTANVAASTTVYVHMRPEAEVTNLVRDVQQDYYLTLDDLSFLIFGDEAFNIDIENGFAGDIWNAKLMFKYRNKDFGIAMPNIAYSPPVESKKWCLW